MSCTAVPSFVVMALRSPQLLHVPLLDCGLMAEKDNGDMKAMTFVTQNVAQYLSYIVSQSPFAMELTRF